MQKTKRKHRSFKNHIKSMVNFLYLIHIIIDLIYILNMN